METYEMVHPDQIEKPDAAPPDWLKRSIAMRGQLEPVRLVRTKNKLLKIESGHRRVATMIYLNCDQIKAIITDACESDSAINALTVNIVRQRNIADEVKKISLLAKSMSPEEIVAATGFSKQTVKRLINLSRLSPQVVEAMREGKIIPTAASRMLNLPHETQARLVAEERVSRAEIDREIRSFKNDMLDRLDTLPTNDAPIDDEVLLDMLERRGRRASNGVRKLVSQLKLALKKERKK